jgi:hypothetical protein
MEEVCRPTPNETCTFGLILNTACHLKAYKYTRIVGIYSYADLQNENKKLLLRCGPRTEVQETICLQHEKLLL